MSRATPVFLAERLGAGRGDARTVQLAGLLHDIGKIGIPDVILRKPSELTAESTRPSSSTWRWATHRPRRARLDDVRAGIRHHHERWDGNGYLDGLEGDEIPLIARILAVCRCLLGHDHDAAVPPGAADRGSAEALERCRRQQLDERLVVAFVNGIETAADAPLPGEETTALWRPELWVA